VRLFVDEVDVGGIDVCELNDAFVDGIDLSQPKNEHTLCATVDVAWYVSS
jgi:hypothetical protein